MKLLLSLFLVCIGTGVFAQDYLDKIAQQSCDCTKNLNDTLSKDRMYMELGLCMIKTAEPYKKQLKKDYNINFDNIDNEGEALGKIIGIRMASICPDALLKISDKVNGAKTSSKDQELFSGRITKIEKDFFVVFTVNDNAGKSLKFYWLTNAESNIELINKYDLLFDKDVKVKYTITSLFDPKIGDYRNFNVIEKIEQLSR
ncbi:MAG: hypothetical protein V4506_18935 [Bacteroidota bacterium]